MFFTCLISIIYMLNLCKKLPEDDVRKIETCRNIDGLYVNIYIYSHTIYQYSYIYIYIYIFTYNPSIYLYIYIYIYEY